MLPHLFELFEFKKKPIFVTPLIIFSFLYWLSFSLFSPFFCFFVCAGGGGERDGVVLLLKAGSGSFTMSRDLSSNQERLSLSFSAKEEADRKIHALDSMLKKIKESYENDDHLLLAKRKQLQGVEAEYDMVERYQRSVLGHTKEKLQKLDRANNSHIFLFLPPRDEEESLATLQDSVRFMREENERLAAEVMRNDHLLRFGPSMGTLALRIKRAADSRNYAELQRGAAESRQEVNALDFHLRNEEARLFQAQKDMDKIEATPDLAKPELYYRIKQASVLKEKLQGSRFRIGELVRQKLEIFKQEDQLDTKIRELHDLLNACQQS